MTRVILSVGAGLALALMSAASAAERAGGAPPHDGDFATAAGDARARGNAQAPNARLAALIDQDGNVIRGKNVASVTNPGTGRYCIRPADGMNVNRIVPVVSVDYSTSSYNESLVQYRASGKGCPDGTIAVVTFADVNLDGLWGFSGTVGFTIVVP